MFPALGAHPSKPRTANDTATQSVRSRHGRSSGVANQRKLPPQCSLADKSRSAEEPAHIPPAQFLFCVGFAPPLLELDGRLRVASLDLWLQATIATSGRGRTSAPEQMSLRTAARAYDDVLAVLALREGRHRAQRDVGAAPILPAAHWAVNLAPEGVLSSNAHKTGIA